MFKEIYIKLQISAVEPLLSKQQNLSRIALR